MLLRRNKGLLLFIPASEDSQAINTRLFPHLQSRGSHLPGWWGCGPSGRVLMHDGLPLGRLRHSLSLRGQV